VRIGARLGRRKRGELLGLLRPCFSWVEPWLQAGKYLAAVSSALPRRNGWMIAEHAGDRTPDRTQRLLSRAAWDTSAAMGVVRRFAAAGLDEAARWAGLLEPRSESTFLCDRRIARSWRRGGLRWFARERTAVRSRQNQEPRRNLDWHTRSGRPVHRRSQVY
jgi:hypothetical protein